MQNEKIDIKSMTPEELRQWLAEHGQADFRARQVFSWLAKGAGSFGEMSNIGLTLRGLLESAFFICPPEIAGKQVSESDGTVKYLWRLRDGNMVESVVMRYGYGNTACISTQAGCRMGCAFCASAGLGFIRNLAPSEMLDQVMVFPKGQRSGNIKHSSNGNRRASGQFRQRHALSCPCKPP
jgi:23S rRNA (adenine2503-C2)-methyltransferase